jgi:arginyl-tRNA synthetase
MTKNKAHGDWATNVALVLAPTLRMAPHAVAKIIVQHIAVDDPLIASAQVAGPGFINLTLHPRWLAEMVQAIDRAGENFGTSSDNAGSKVLVEFVSANPNGPITLGHGRNAAIGDVLASLFAAVGFTVHREHYVNDALNSTQMNNFGKSVIYRYKQVLGQNVPPEDEYEWLYRGDYVTDIARNILARSGDIYANVDMNDPDTVVLFRNLAQEGMLAEQESDLAAFGVKFDSYFNESTLHDDGSVANAIEELKKSGHSYVKDGALWFRTTDFGDDKDRVLLRENGTPTYIAGDLAYHKNKFDRGYDRCVDVWGADHAGYIARTKAAVSALGYDASKLDIVLYQLVKILKNGEFVTSSKRKGDVLCLKADLIDEIGKDAARFYFLVRSPNTDIDIDIDLAKKTDKENPVYYVQYAHARICQTLDKAKEIGDDLTDIASRADLSLLTLESESDLVKKLSEYPEEVRISAQEYAPHRLVQYARDLASTFHSYYDSGNRNAGLRVVCEDAPTREARLALVNVTRIVLKNVLALLGISAPERM